MNPDEEVKVWVLTPKNIDDYCEKSGASKEEIMRKYNEALAQNQILYGYIASENPWS